MSETRERCPKRCPKCKQTILWEQIGGMRVLFTFQRPRSGNVIAYRTQCGCGQVVRDDQGRRVRGPFPQ